MKTPNPETASRMEEIIEQLNTLISVANNQIVLIKAFQAGILKMEVVHHNEPEPRKQYSFSQCIYECSVEINYIDENPYILPLGKGFE